MAIDDELSYDDMHRIRVNGLSDLVLRAYYDAKNEVKPLGDSIKLKWEHAKVNADKHSFLIYAEKYINGDESVRRSIKNYLADFLLKESQEEYLSEIGKIKSEKKKSDFVWYVAAGFGVLSMFNEVFLLPSIGLFYFYFNKRPGLVKSLEKADFNYAFRECDYVSLEELPNEDLREAFELANEKIRKI